MSSWLSPSLVDSLFQKYLVDSKNLQVSKSSWLSPSLVDCLFQIVRRKTEIQKLESFLCIIATAGYIFTYLYNSYNIWRQESMKRPSRWLSREQSSGSRQAGTPPSVLKNINTKELLVESLASCVWWINTFRLSMFSGSNVDENLFPCSHSSSPSRVGAAISFG